LFSAIEGLGESLEFRVEAISEQGGRKDATAMLDASAVSSASRILHELN
jgi:hypothetical protein